MIGRRMEGTVTGHATGYFRVECPDAPPHLKTLNLVGWQMKGAVVGDAVTLEYQKYGGGSLWNVVEVRKPFWTCSYCHTSSGPDDTHCVNCGRKRL